MLPTDNEDKLASHSRQSPALFHGYRVAGQRAIVVSSLAYRYTAEGTAMSHSSSHSLITNGSGSTGPGADLDPARELEQSQRRANSGVSAEKCSEGVSVAHVSQVLCTR